MTNAEREDLLARCIAGGLDREGAGEHVRLEAARRAAERRAAESPTDALCRALRVAFARAVAQMPG